MGPEAVAGRLAVSTGVTLAYARLGAASASAAPVLMLPAWGEARGAFDRVLEQMPERVHALALDLRGHGDSDTPVDGYSLRQVADDVVAFLDAAGIGPVVLVGSSSGGYVAQQVAVSHPGRVAGLVLVGSPRSLEGRPPFADEVEQLADPVGEDWVRQSFSWFPLHTSVPASYVDERVADAVRIPAHVWRAALSGLCSARPPTDVGTITAPTLVIRGDRDELIGREQQQALADAIPGAHLVTYEDTGHLVLWEQPERVARDLVTFVDGLGD